MHIHKSDQVSNVQSLYLIIQIKFNFWPHSIIKHGICYSNVRPSVCCSWSAVCLSHICVKVLKYALHLTMEQYLSFSEAIFNIPKFTHSPGMNALNRGTHCRQWKFDQ